jgi:hypothetical protein
MTNLDLEGLKGTVQGFDEAERSEALCVIGEGCADTAFVKSCIAIQLGKFSFRHG